MTRRVRGSFFVEYVRMLRRRKDVDWSEVLTPEDLPCLEQRIEADAWYPMESFERLGLAILSKLDGAVRKYADGKLVSEATYKDGKATGSYIEYRAGRPSVTGQFAADRKTGVWTQYDADGHVAQGRAARSRTSASRARRAS